MQRQTHFRIFYPFRNAKINIIGDFNGWEDSDKFTEEFPYYYLNIFIPHKSAYLLKINGRVIRDPSSVFFDEDLNCINWDFKDSSAYKMKYKTVNNDKSLIILQSDLEGLITHFRGKSGKVGSEVSVRHYYDFISQSGIIDKIKSLGFNAVQFLPVSKSVDGSNWKYRYLCAFPKAIEDKWGDINEFAQMIDAFHEQKISFIQDIILSHTPFKDFKVNGIDAKESSLPDHLLGDETSWGTKRYKYEDEHVRKYLIESVLHYIKNFRVDGFRVDNVDGILRYGDNGDGEDRPGGRKFLQELNTEIYKLNPKFIVNYESHYFENDNAKMLIAPLNSHPKALGATAYTSSRETYFFQTDYMIKGADLIRPSRIKEIIEEKEWGKSNSCIADFHNHDAASGLMEMRATGSYAYDAILHNNHHLHYHAVGKIKIMEAIISLCLEGRSLDLMQTFLMQTGSFDHDSSIHWYLEMIEANKALVEYKTKINEIMNYPAFYPDHVDKRKILNCDDLNKTITFQKDKFIVFLNMGSEMLAKYSTPVPNKGKYKIILNSDEFKYCGSGRMFYTQIFETKPGPCIKFDWIAPYAIIVLKEV